jgi:hypothetical protein
LVAERLGYIIKQKVLSTMAALAVVQENLLQIPLVHLEPRDRGMTAGEPLDTTVAVAVVLAPLVSMQILQQIRAVMVVLVSHLL